MAVSRVWVEWGPNGVIRIFKFRRDAIAVELAGGQVAEWPKAEAIKNLREQIFVRCNSQCELCSRWVDRTTGEMHEKHPRGKLANDGTFGEYSLDNSIFICNTCHRNEHSNRNWFKAGVRHA